MVRYDYPCLTADCLTHPSGIEWSSSASGSRDSNAYSDTFETVSGDDSSEEELYYDSDEDGLSFKEAKKELRRDYIGNISSTCTAHPQDIALYHHVFKY